MQQEGQQQGLQGNAVCVLPRAAAASTQQCTAVCWHKLGVEPNQFHYRQRARYWGLHTAHRQPACIDRTIDQYVFRRLVYEKSFMDGRLTIEKQERTSDIGSGEIYLCTQNVENAEIRIASLYFFRLFGACEPLLTVCARAAVQPAVAVQDTGCCRCGWLVLFVGYVIEDSTEYSTQTK